jgi:uncharacterized membrane protein YeaQ/YmgE (transglycosylase-associated protein family)
MGSRRRSKKYLWIGAAAGLIVGICGNLLAAWIQEDLLKNAFGPIQIGLIVLCGVIGIFIVVWLESGLDTQKEEQESAKGGSENSYTNLKLVWSKFRSRGKHVRVDDVKAVGSEIDIDTK